MEQFVNIGQQNERQTLNCITLVLVKGKWYVLQRPSPLFASIFPVFRSDSFRHCSDFFPSGRPHMNKQSGSAAARCRGFLRGTPEELTGIRFLRDVMSGNSISDLNHVGSFQRRNFFIKRWCVASLMTSLRCDVIKALNIYKKGERNGRERGAVRARGACTPLGDRNGILVAEPVFLSNLFTCISSSPAEGAKDENYYVPVSHHRLWMYFFKSSPWFSLKKTFFWNNRNFDIWNLTRIHTWKPDDSFQHKETRQMCL